MTDEEIATGPLIGRSGVLLVCGDLLIGALALPLAASARHAFGGVPLEVELLRPPLWASAMAAALLWTAALRVFDSGYPSARLPLRRIVAATFVWALATSGVIYLLDKELASRLLVLLGAAFVLAGAAGTRRFTPAAALGLRTEQLPLLSAESERALARGEPVSLDLSRISTALARPTVVFESGRIWIYPSALGPSERLLKRSIDITLSALLLLVAAAPMAAIAIAILVTSGRPIIFRDERAGLFGRPFHMRKFRSMRIGANRERSSLWGSSETKGPAFKIADDPRVTGLGRILRRFSLDELPQLFDVIQGRMSLVGPRPAGLDELERYDDRHRLRLTVRPGVTGLWQVRRRLDADFEQRMADDLEYIRRWSPLLDVVIVLRSIGVVVAGRGV